MGAKTPWPRRAPNAVGNPPSAAGSIFGTQFLTTFEADYAFREDQSSARNMRLNWLRDTSAPARAYLLRRQRDVFGDTHLARLGSIPVAQLYNLRNAAGYPAQRVVLNNARGNRAGATIFLRNSTETGIVMTVNVLNSESAMNNTVTVAEIKRRGMAAIEDGLRRGPVHIIKRNQLAAVVLSEDEYQRLAHGKMPAAGVMTAVQWLLAQPAGGKRSKARIDAALKVERTW